MRDLVQTGSASRCCQFFCCQRLCTLQVGGALRRYKLLMWLNHIARFAPGIAFQLQRPKAQLIVGHILWLP
jgi:hypothetical protein